ncbi:NlpC/P60 family protein [Planosporangium thailandense]|uniref:NlpC/P60 family protein n=1 Tax=Planosporangium thailandense TaxID=765197 RepID=A0ABX0XRX2_9ACTN|nr:NlpC/P60 family protein [Planosporangium thailandense]NJC68762.1 NlpC/P60 family protein [Planosporangium thailandense]
MGAVCVGLVIALGLSTSAHAAPAAPGDIESQIDAAWARLEPLIEQHNNVKAQLADNQAKAAQLADQIRPLALQVDIARGRVSTISAQAYKSGQASAFTALLVSSKPTSLADQLSLLDAVAKGQQDSVADAARLKSQYDAQKKPLDELVKKLSAQEAELAQQEKSINDQIAQYNQMRLAAFGTTASPGNPRLGPCPVSYDGSPGAKAARFACGKIGSPYVFGAVGPNVFDCSGLTMWAWSQATGGAVSLYHYTVTQFNETKRVTRDQLRPGDLIFYGSDIHHVAMYVGNNWMVNAPHSGDVVRMAPVDEMPIAGYGRPG